MIYIEMTKDFGDGGSGAWGYRNCVWAPTVKGDGAKWPYWQKVSEIKNGDIIIHLRGSSPRTVFDGYSEAEMVNKFTMDVSEMISGMYFIYLKTSDGVFKKKFLILK